MNTPAGFFSNYWIQVLKKSKCLLKRYSTYQSGSIAELFLQLKFLICFSGLGTVLSLINVLICSQQNITGSSDILEHNYPLIPVTSIETPGAPWGSQNNRDEPIQRSAGYAGSWVLEVRDHFRTCLPTVHLKRWLEASSLASRVLKQGVWKPAVVSGCEKNNGVLWG